MSQNKIHRVSENKTSVRTNRCSWYGMWSFWTAQRARLWNAKLKGSKNEGSLFIILFQTSVLVSNKATQVPEPGNNIAGFISEKAFKGLHCESCSSQLCKRLENERHSEVHQESPKGNHPMFWARKRDVSQPHCRKRWWCKRKTIREESSKASKSGLDTLLHPHPPSRSHNT